MGNMFNYEYVDIGYDDNSTTNNILVLFDNIQVVEQSLLKNIINIVCAW